MALQELNFTIPHDPAVAYTTLPKDWSHTGVVGSGDLEILLRRISQNGAVTAKIVTPVRGYDDIWEKVIRRFTLENEVGNLHIEINDNNATPFIVSLRLKQALLEAREETT